MVVSAVSNIRAGHIYQWLMASVSSQEEFLYVHATRKPQSAVYRPLYISHLPRIRCGGGRTRTVVILWLLVTIGWQNHYLWNLADAHVVSYDTNARPPPTDTDPQSQARQNEKGQALHAYVLCYCYRGQVLRIWVVGYVVRAVHATITSRTMVLRGILLACHKGS
jgi:hypothetical protein